MWMSRNVIVWAAVLVLPAAVQADVLTLKSGGLFYGKVDSQSADSIKFRTEMGLMEIARRDVARLEPGIAPWDEYDKIKADYGATADDQYRLGLWCRDHGLAGKARVHFKRALDLDPSHDGAHTALGHYREDGEWKVPGASSRPAGKHAPAAKVTPEEKLLRELITRWTVRVNAIYNGKLKNQADGSKLFEEGRRQILAIQDPLAVSVIGSILSKGSQAVRLLMVESLAGFKNEGRDESTMNLVVISLFDPDPVVRRAAAKAIVPRKDERIVDRYRKALCSSEDMVIRNAAVVVGMLKAREAVRDLAKCLYTVQRQTVRYARQEIISDVYRSFSGQTIIRPHDASGAPGMLFTPDGVAVMATGTLVGTRWIEEERDVKMYRTDVQEALITITGQNYGFEPEAWLRWADEHDVK